MLKQHPEDQEKYPNTDEPNKDRVAAKLKTIRTGYRKACDIGVVVEELSLPFTDFVKIFGRISCRISTSLPNAIENPLQDQLSSTNFVNTVPDNLSPVEPESFEDEEEEF